LKILVATPTAKTVEERYCFSLFGLCKYETARGNDIDLTLQRGPYIHRNRNLFVEEFLAGDWEWLLQIDMDVMFPCTALQSLLSREKDIVFGMYAMMKNGRPYSTFWKLQSNDKYSSIGSYGKGLIEIDAGGTGLCLAHRRVFEAIRDKGFSEQDPWFAFDPAPPPEGYYSEDITFSRRAKASGFSLWGDCDIETGHVKDVLVHNKVINAEGGMYGKINDEKGRSRKARRARRG